MQKFCTVFVLGLILVLSVYTCFVSGEETPVSLISITANRTTVSPGENGTFLIQAYEVNPNATVSDTKTTIIPLEKLIPQESCAAAIILSIVDGNETVSVVQASDVVYSAENRTLKLKVFSQRYYDGTLLAEYLKKQNELKPGEYNATSISLEHTIPNLENVCPMSCTKYGCTCT